MSNGINNTSNSAFVLALLQGIAYRGDFRLQYGKLSLKKSNPFPT